MTTTNNAAQAADQEIEAIMEQAQVFASAWSLLGGPFDNGSGLETAERENANLRALLSRLRAPVAQAEVMDALNWVDDFIARCNRDDRGSCESVNVLRRALASAPVADERAACPADACQGGKAVRDALMAFDAAMSLCDDYPELQHHRDALLFAVQKARAALASAHAVDEQDRTAMSQFLTDVMTAAGLVAHGKQCKALADRLGKACMALRLSGLLASAPVAGEAQQETEQMAEELSELASDMAYEANQEIDQEKASRATLIERAERALRRVADAVAQASSVAGEAQPVAWANEDGDPISDAMKRARLDLYGKHYTRPLYAAPQASDALFWYRPRSDGGYEGPIHNDSIDQVRKLSGAWVPLVAAHQAGNDSETDA